MKNPHGLIANLSLKQSSKFYLRKMTLVNVKTKQDLIKLKKNLIKRAEEEKLKDFNQDACKRFCSHLQCIAVTNVKK